MKTLPACCGYLAALVLAGSSVMSQVHYSDRSVQVNGEWRTLDDSVVIKQCPALEYPAEAARAGTSGVVLFMVQVDSTGRANTPEVTMANDEIFIPPTLAAGSGLLFNPPTVDHRPVSMTQGLVAVYEMATDSSGHSLPRASLSFATAKFWKEYRVTDPIVLQRQEPVYPPAAREQKIEGKVWVKIWVNPEGIPVNVSVLKSASSLLDEAALQAAGKFTFQPGTIQKKAAWCSVVVPVAFKLQ